MTTTRTTTCTATPPTTATGLGLGLSVPSFEPDLAEAVRSVMAAAEPGPAPDPGDEAGLALDVTTWDRLAAGGFSALGIPEEVGGSGGSLRELAVVVHETARALGAVPVVEHAWLAGPWLTLLGGRISTMRATAADAPGVSVDAGRASGTVRRVPALRWCTHALLLTGAEHPRVAVVDLGETGVGVTPGTNAAGEPRDTLTLDEVAVTSVQADLAEREQFRLRGALARGVQLAAVASRVTERTTAYAQQRHQFGRPIAAFQAVQHRLTAMAGDTVAMQAAVVAAVAAETHGDPDASVLAMVAKAETSAAAGRVAAAAHQIHGALGFTLEHELGQATKRLWAWRDEFGHDGSWDERLGGRLAPDLWEQVTR
jgi:acyl-CoA dehydrogenase